MDTIKGVSFDLLDRLHFESDYSLPRCTQADENDSVDGGWGNLTDSQ